MPVSKREKWLAVGLYLIAVCPIPFRMRVIRMYWERYKYSSLLVKHHGEQMMEFSRRIGPYALIPFLLFVILFFILSHLHTATEVKVLLILVVVDALLFVVFILFSLVVYIYGLIGVMKGNYVRYPFVSK